MDQEKLQQAVELLNSITSSLQQSSQSPPPLQAQRQGSRGSAGSHIHVIKFSPKRNVVLISLRKNVSRHSWVESALPHLLDRTSKILHSVQENHSVQQQHWYSVLEGKLAGRYVRARAIGVKVQTESFEHFWVTTSELVLSHGDNLLAGLQNSSMSAHNVFNSYHS